MARRIHLRTDISVDELERRYRAAKEPHERSWWQILWLLSRGQLAKEIAESTGLFARIGLDRSPNAITPKAQKGCAIGSTPTPSWLLHCSPPNNWPNSPKPYVVQPLKATSGWDERWRSG